MIELLVAQTWDGQALPQAHHARLELRMEPEGLHVTVDAPWFDDPLPASAPGSTERLWEHEVVELFLAGPGDEYLELELGPGGHFLVLQLDGVRKVRRQGLPISYRVLERVPGVAGVDVAPGRYRGEALLSRACLPAGACRGNAYLIHGVGPARRYHAHAAVPGAAPDFHQPARFVPISLDAR